MNIVTSYFYKNMIDQCTSYYHVPPEVFNVAMMNHAFADMSAIAGPLSLHQHTIGDNTIFHFAVPAMWGLTINELLWYTAVIAVVWGGIIGLGVWVLMKFLGPTYRYGGKNTMAEQIDRELDDQAQIKYLNQWEIKQMEKELNQKMAKYGTKPDYQLQQDIYELFRELEERIKRDKGNGGLDHEE